MTAVPFAPLSRRPHWPTGQALSAAATQPVYRSARAIFALAAR